MARNEKSWMKGLFTACNISFKPTSWWYQADPVRRGPSSSHTLAEMKSWKLPPGNPCGAHHSTYSLRLCYFWTRVAGGTLPLCKFDHSSRCQVKLEAPSKWQYAPQLCPIIKQDEHMVFGWNFQIKSDLSLPTHIFPLGLPQPRSRLWDLLRAQKGAMVPMSRKERLRQRRARCSCES